MRIAQVSPLYERVPPIGYGGTERVVSYLTEELVRRGHQVTLFASGDSMTSARLAAGSPSGLRLAGTVHPVPPHLEMIEEVVQRADEFDILHFHTEYLHFSLAARCPTPSVTTLHGRLDRPEYPGYFRRCAALDFVSISNAQRAPMPWLGWTATNYHGMPRDLIAPSYAPGTYLAFLGRFSKEKGFEAAVEMARRAGMPLKVAGKVDPEELDYLARTVQPLLALPFVEHVGEIGGVDRDRFLAGAHALLFPIDWPEPFGLVMIEAMAAGTPVVAYRRGAVPEVVDHGVTGFVVDDVDEAVRALADIPRLDRRRIRAVFEQRFSVERMTDDYLSIYRDLCARGDSHGRDQQRPRVAGTGAPGTAFRASRP